MAGSLLSRTLLSRRCGLGVRFDFSVDLGRFDWIHLDRRQDFFQALEDFVAIDALDAGLRASFSRGRTLGFALDLALGLGLHSGGCNLQREFVASAVLEDVIILCRLLARSAS